MEGPKEQCPFSSEGGSGLSRREFLKVATLGAVAASSLGGLGETPAAMATPDSRPKRFSAVGRVVHVRHAGVMADPLRPDARIVRQMVERSIQELTGKNSLSKAWGALVTPEDVVGIKVNCTGGHHVSSHPAVVEAIITGLREVGVKEENILLWDRHPGRLEVVGYPLNLTSKGVRCYPTESEAAGYDPEVFYEADPLGKLSRSDLEYGKVAESRRSYFSRIVTRQITALITVPVIKDALQAGVTLSLKNLAFGTIDNTPRFHPPEILCDPAIAEVCAHPILRQRAVLHVLDGLHGQYDKGPSPDPRYVWKHNGLLFSTDPVALDQVGMEIIEARRQQEGLPPLAKVGRPAKHIATAARLGLGTNDRGKIEEVKLELSG